MAASSRTPGYLNARTTIPARHHLRFSSVLRRLLATCCCPRAPSRRRRAGTAGAGAAPPALPPSPMADKENSAAAAPPRLTRAAAKRKRVALTQLPAHPDDGNNEPARKQQQRLLLLPAAKPEPQAAAASDDDPQLCSDIHSYLRSMERQAKRRPDADYMAAVQVDLSPNMRAILVDWLVEVAEEYKLVADTLHLTISCIDRYLSVHTLVSRQRLQMLGVSAMLAASKYEEMCPPDVEFFCYMTDNTYSRQEILKTENDILNVLKFLCQSLTVLVFLFFY